MIAVYCWQLDVVTCNQILYSMLMNSMYQCKLVNLWHWDNCYQIVHRF